MKIELSYTFFSPEKKMTALADDFQLLLCTEKEKDKQNTARTLNIGAIEWRDTSTRSYTLRCMFVTGSTIRNFLSFTSPCMQNDNFHYS